MLEINTAVQIMKIKQKSNFRYNYDDDIVMSYGNAMQSEGSNAQGRLVKRFKRVLRYKENSWSGFIAPMD